MEETPSDKIIRELLEIQLFSDEKKDHKIEFLSTLYSIVGLENFVKIIESLGGKEIAIPKAEDFKEAVQTAMAYYYKHFSDYQWSGEERKKFEQAGNAKYKTKRRVDKLNTVIENYIYEIQTKYCKENSQ